MEYAGAIYHVTVRMVGQARENRQEFHRSACLFRDDEERERFLDQLGERVEAYGVRLYAYCLMLTHFHLYLETPQANLSRFMHSLETAYTVYSNLRRQRHGPLVGRYKAKPVGGDDYHLGLSRYVHLNPVRIHAVLDLPKEEMLRRLRTYRWSSYRAYAGREETPDWLSCGPILALCGGGRRTGKQRAAYRQFVESAIGGDDEFGRMIKASAPAVGAPAFIDWIRERLIACAGARQRPEDANLRSLKLVLPAEDVAGVVADVLGVERRAFNERRRNSDLRGIALRALCRHAGLTHREAAVVVGMGTGGAAAKQIHRIEARLIADPHLRQHLARIDDALNRKTIR